MTSNSLVFLASFIQSRATIIHNLFIARLLLLAPNVYIDCQ